MPQPLVTENVKHIVDKETNKIRPNFHNQLLYVETKISSSDLKELKDKARICLENQAIFLKANKILAGNMEKEFFLNDSFKKIVLPYAITLANKFHKLNTDEKPVNWNNTNLCFFT